MNPNPDHEELLHELLAESSAHSPSADTVLQLVRTEQMRRRRHRKLAVAGAGLAALGLSAALWFTGNPVLQPPAQVAAEPFAVKRVNDQEFLDLLAQQDQPVALLKLANGERQLLMVVHQADTATQPD